MQKGGSRSALESIINRTSRCVQRTICQAALVGRRDGSALIDSGQRIAHLHLARSTLHSPVIGTKRPLARFL